MSSRKPRSYTLAFRQEAIKMVEEQHLSYRVAAEKLGIPEATLAGWVHGKGMKKKDNNKPGDQSVTELKAELSQLRKELSEAKMERDILKKAAAYFAKHSR